MMKACAALACAFAAGTAIAQDGPTPEEQAQSAIETRQAVFKLLGWNMGPLGGMLRGNVDFDAAVVETNMSRIASLGPMIPDLFASDTSEFDSLETEALDNIWTNMDDFADKASALVDAANAAVETAAGGDDRATRQAIAAVGQACGSCHDDFRLD